MRRDRPRARRQLCPRHVPYRTAALSCFKARVAKGTLIQAGEAASWDASHAQYEVRRINHRDVYSDDSACTNMTEEYFTRLRRAEQGHHHHIAGVYLLRYAQEASWREDHRLEVNSAQDERIGG